MWDFSRNRVERGCGTIDGDLEPSVAQVILEPCKEGTRKPIAGSFVHETRMGHVVKGACIVNGDDPS